MEEDLFQNTELLVQVGLTLEKNGVNTAPKQKRLTKLQNNSSHLRTLPKMTDLKHLRFIIIDGLDKKDFVDEASNFKYLKME